MREHTNSSARADASLSSSLVRTIDAPPITSSTFAGRWGYDCVVFPRTSRTKSPARVIMSRQRSVRFWRAAMQAPLPTATEEVEGVQDMILEVAGELTHIRMRSAPCYGELHPRIDSKWRCSCMHSERGQGRQVCARRKRMWPRDAVCMLVITHLHSSISYE